MTFAAGPATEIRVAAIISTHDPEIELLAALIERVRGSVRWLMIFDDASPSAALASITALIDEERQRAPGLFFLSSRENVGLAEALNRSINWFETLGDGRIEGLPTHYLFLDQDSLPEIDMVARLVAAEEVLAADGRRVAAVGPRLVDPATGRVIRPMHFRSTPTDSGVYAADLLIISGMLVRRPALLAIGLMDPGLFIDNIDLEWTFRAYDKGFTPFVVTDASMIHRIGKKHPVAGIGTVTVHSPDRLYYITRNRISLYARPLTPWAWICRDVPRLVGKMLLHSLLVGPRRENFRAFRHGVRDALLGRSGPRTARAVGIATRNA